MWKISTYKMCKKDQEYILDYNIYFISLVIQFCQVVTVHTEYFQNSVKKSEYYLLILFKLNVD